jgi:hypothetical protein
MSETAERFTSYCRERAGERLRSVVAYDESGYELVFLREDLRARYDEGQFDWLIGRASAVHEEIHAAGAQDSPLGTAQATVHYFENAFVVQLVMGAYRGYFATFDSRVGQALGDFIDNCLQCVHTDERSE